MTDEAGTTTADGRYGTGAGAEATRVTAVRSDDGPCGPIGDDTADAVAAAVRRVLGADAELGSGQRDAIAAAVVDDCLAVLPPAAGKTAVYAVTGDVLGRRTIVVSPTLALHRDQVEHLRAAGLTAEILNSDLPAKQHAEVLGAFADGDLEFLVTSPEQLAKPDVLAELQRARPTLLAVDEVHCVCDWGPDFRPDYLALGAVRRALGSPRLLGLTATASVPAREEILDLLGVPDACVVVRDVDRPGTHLAGRTIHDEDAKWDQVVREVTEGSGAEGVGIVYVGTQRHTEHLRDLLRDAGMPTDTVESFHGGLARRERSRVQEAFTAGTVRVVVATSAFGMGIDKPDVRWVFHGDTPTSIDAYHQEIGRAGRDGGPAHAVLFHRPQDLARPKLFASGKDARVAALATVIAAIRLHPDEGVAQAELADAAGLSKAALSRAVPALVALDAAVQVPGRRLRAGSSTEEVAAIAGSTAGLVARSRERQQTKVELVRRFAEAAGCRRRTLLEVLGESRVEACGFCDHCDAGDPGDPGSRGGASRGEPTPGETVAHDAWGRGTVQTVSDDQVVVLFDDGGYRTLSVPVVRDQELLTSV